MPQPGAPLFTPWRLALYGTVSVAAAAGVVVRAFRERSNFYAATVWLARSNGCMLVLLNFGIFMSLMLGKACQAVFFGSLRPIEVEHLYERSWYAVTETLLAMTIFRDEFDSSFVLLFGTLLFLKVFHWLCADRVELMEQSPSISRLFIARMVAALWTLICLDLLLVAFTVEVLILDHKRMGIMIMFASEFLILTATMCSTMAKFGLNLIDLRQDEPWEAKSLYVSAVDLFTDFLKLATYVCFFCLILTYYGLPLNIVRDVYVTARSFFGRIRDLLRYRAATRNMDTRFPNATHEDLRRTDGTCIICREEMNAAGPDPDAQGAFEGLDDAPPGTNMQGGLNYTPKKLLCGHIFHFHCLRAWLERQQSCPTCRRTVFDTAPPTGAAGDPGIQPPQQQQPQQPPAAPWNQGAAGQGGFPTPTPTAPGPQHQSNHHFDSNASASQRHLQDLLDQVIRPGGAQVTAGPSSGQQRAPGGASYTGAREQSLSAPQTGRTANSGWVPPPPSSLQPPPYLDLPGPQSPEAADVVTERADAREGGPISTSGPSSADPVDPRAAARAAFIKRYDQGPASSSSSSPVPVLSSTTPIRTQGVAVSSSSASHSLASSSISPLQPPRSAPNLPPLSSHPLSAEELSLLSQQTRSGLQEQLRTLERAQAEMWRISVELTRALSAIPVQVPTSAGDLATEAPQTNVPGTEPPVPTAPPPRTREPTLLDVSSSSSSSEEEGDDDKVSTHSTKVEGTNGKGKGKGRALDDPMAAAAASSASSPSAGPSASASASAAASAAALPSDPDPDPPPAAAFSGRVGDRME